MLKIAYMAFGMIGLGLAAPAQSASVFIFQFDNQGVQSGDGPLIGPIVGTGAFTSPIDLAPGTYDLSSLAGFAFNFSFEDGSTFSTADIVTPITGVGVRITDIGGGLQRLFVTEGSGPGINAGPLGGAMDMISGSAGLSFQPSFAGGNFFYQTMGPSEDFAGRYLATSIPEPATWALMMLGFAAVGSMARRRRKVTVTYV